MKNFLFFWLKPVKREENDNFGIIACYKTDSFLLGKILTDFAIKNDLKLQEEAISYLIENLGDNYQIIINELEKLLLLDSKVISYDLVKNLISTTGSSVHEDIVFDCLSGKKNLLGNNNDGWNLSSLWKKSRLGCWIWP